jgi:hypothetical protein
MTWWKGNTWWKQKRSICGGQGDSYGGGRGVGSEGNIEDRREVQAKYNENRDGGETVTVCGGEEAEREDLPHRRLFWTYNKLSKSSQIRRSLYFIGREV